MRARTRRWRTATAAVGLGFGIAAVGAPAQAANRAYELVTPPGSHAEVRPGGGAATPGGDTVCFNSETAIAGAPSNGIDTADDGFCSRRTAAGWQTEWVTGPVVRDPHGGKGSQVYFVSPDGGRVVFASDMGIFPDYPGPPTGRTGSGTPSAFMWENGQTRWLAPTPLPLPEEGDPAFIGREPLAASEDLTHGVFLSRLQLLPQDANSVPDVYEWTPDGIRLVSRDAAGDAVGGLPPLGTDADQMAAEPGTISRDGSRIFFQHTGALAGGAPAGRQSVFMRQGDELTLVSPRLGPGPAEDVRFVGASDDGGIVYLLTAEQLTSAPKQPGNAIYRYDVTADALSLVATDAGGSGLVFLGTSADGSTVVYRSSAFPPTLFVNRDGVSSEIGRLGPLDSASVTSLVGSTRSDKRALRISADGEVVVFASTGTFPPTAATGRAEVYRWTPAEGTQQISELPGLPAPTGNAMITNVSSILPGDPRQSVLNTARERPTLGRVLTDDGARIYFETPQALVSGDINSAIDVYEWDGGRVSLVSPGTQRDDALYHDSSADGSTVFFTTTARLIPELDRNASPDLYAARIGGGFPLPQPEPICEGANCQGTPAAPPVAPIPGSSTLDGPGDAEEPAPTVARQKVQRLTTAQRKAFARRGRTVLTVRTNAKGVVTATVRARVGRRTSVVARSVRAVRGGASARLPLALSKAARAELRTNRRLRLVISVAYSESDTTVSQVVMLRG